MAASEDRVAATLDAVRAHVAGGIHGQLAAMYRTIPEYQQLSDAIIIDDVVASGIRLLTWLCDELESDGSTSSAQLEEVRQAASRRFGQGIAVEAMLQGYRLWGRNAWAIVRTCAMQVRLEPETALRLADRVMAFVDDISAAVTVRSVELLAGSSIDEAMRARDFFALIADERPDESAVSREAQGFGITTSADVVALVVQVANGGQSHPLPERSEPLRADMTTLARALGPASASWVMTIGSGGLLCMLQVAGRAAAEVASDVVARMLAEGGATIRAGIGGEHRSVAGFARSLDEARHAAGFAQPGASATFESVLLSSVLVGGPYSAQVADVTIGRLESYDAAHDTRLAQTLRTYIATQHSLTRTASRMHVQPNTVSYRLDRIAAITQYDPRTPDGILMLAIGAYVARE